MLQLKHCAQKKELLRNSDPTSVLASDQLRCHNTTNGDDDDDDDNDDADDVDDDDEVLLDTVG